MKHPWENQIIAISALVLSVAVIPIQGEWITRISKATVWGLSGAGLVLVGDRIRRDKITKERAYKENKELLAVEREKQQLQTLLATEYAEKQAELEDAWQQLAEFQRLTIEEGEQKEELLNQLRENTLLEVNQLIEEKDSEIEWLYQEINQLRSLVSQLYKEHCFVGGYAAYIGNKILEVFMGQDLVVFPEDSDSYQILPNGDGRIWVKPSKDVKLYQLQRLGDDILTRVPELASRPIIRAVPGCVEIEFQIGKEDARKHAGLLESDSPVQIDLASDENWLVEAIASTIHLFVNGDTGSGKSELITNWVGLAQHILKSDSGKEPRIIINDIKWTGHPDDGLWFINNQDVVPDYFEMEDNPNRPAHQKSHWTIDGLWAMKDDVDDILDSTRKATFNQSNYPERVPTIYILDEAARVVSRHGKDATEPMLHALQLGRSSKRIFVFAGQPPTCSSYGFQKADLGNTTRVYLRENALRGIDEVCSTTQEKKELRGQVSAWLKLSEEMFNKTGDRLYFGLVKYPGRPAKVVKLPPPGAYINYGQEPSAESPTPLSSATLSTETDGSDGSQSKGCGDTTTSVPTSNEAEFLSRTLQQQIRDARKIEAIRELQRQGKTTMREIVPIVFQDEFPGCKTIDSRQYKAACKRYKELLKIAEREEN